MRYIEDFIIKISLAAVEHAFNLKLQLSLCKKFRQSLLLTILMTSFGGHRLKKEENMFQIGPSFFPIFAHPGFSGFNIIKSRDPGTVSGFGLTK